MYVFILAISAFVIFVSMFRTRHFIKSIFLSAMQGLTAMFAVNLIGDIINVHLSLNWFSTSVGVIGGLPGIIFLLVNDVISVL